MDDRYHVLCSNCGAINYIPDERDYKEFICHTCEESLKEASLEHEKLTDFVGSLNQLDEDDKNTLPVVVELATSSFFFNNPFYFLSLSSKSTIKNIKVSFDKKRMKGKLRGDSAYDFETVSGNLRLNASKAEELVQRINDPQVRLLWEVFWLWDTNKCNHDFGGAVNLCLTEGTEKAESYYLQLLSEDKQRFITLHNLAILNHIKALNLENKAAKKEFSQEIHEKLVIYWSKTYELWEEVLSKEEFLDYVLFRVGELGDPRVTAEFAETLIESIPLLILLTNMRSFLMHSDQNMNISKASPPSFTKRSKFSEPIINNAAHIAVKPYMDKIIYICKELDDVEKIENYSYEKLLEKPLAEGKRYLDLIDTYLAEGDSKRVTCHDKLADASWKCILSDDNRDQDWKKVKSYYDYLQRMIAESQHIKDKIGRDIAAVQEHIDYEQLDSMIGLANEVDEYLKNLNHPISKFKEFCNKIENDSMLFVEVIDDSLGVKHDVSYEASKIHVSIIRDLAIHANNKYKDYELAKNLIEEALENCFDEGQLESLDKDVTAIENNYNLELEGEEKRLELEARSIDTSVGLLKKSEVVITPDIISVRGNSINTEDVTRLRWGIRIVERNYITQRNYTIWVGDSKTMLKIECAQMFAKDEMIMERYLEIVNLLWDVVVVRLIDEAMSKLENGNMINIGDTTLSPQGVYLPERGLFFKKGTDHLCPWNEVRTRSEQGDFIIEATSVKAISKQSVREIDNVHILSALVGHLTKNRNWEKL